MMKNIKSSKEDWYDYYSSRKQTTLIDLVDINDFRNLSHRLLVREIEKCIKAKRSEKHEPDIIEIGAGDSSMLLDIVKRFRLEGNIYGLDYLPEGCKRLEARSAISGVHVNVVCADLFIPPEDLLERFDVVLSFGVVEHFQDLTSVVRAIGRYASKDGLIFTLIPNNKEGIYGWLMKKFNEQVYKAHVMYSKQDLENAHRDAGLQILECKYLVSSNFGMLSWCFAHRKRGTLFWLYKQLTRISKIIWLFESKFGCFKPTPLFSPYILCIARKTL